MKKINFFFALALTIGFTSCSLVGDVQIEKRHYGKGYYVHVRDKHSDATVAENKTALINENSIAENTTPEISPEQAVVSVDQNKVETVAGPESNKSAEVSNRGAEQRAVLSKAENKKTLAPAIKRQHVGVVDPKPTPESGADTSQIVLLLLAIFLSPIAVFLKEGATNRFWIDLICWIVGGGFFFTPFFYGGGLLLFAVIFAILIVLDII